jgi:hypothetical protein
MAVEKAERGEKICGAADYVALLMMILQPAMNVTSTFTPLLLFRLFGLSIIPTQTCDKVS